MRKPWQKQESRLAGLTEGGRRQPGSGNGWARKHDVSTETHLIEAKWTARKSFTLKLVELRALEHNATIEDKDPIFAIEFSEDMGQGIEVARRYVVVPEDQYFRR